MTGEQLEILGQWMTRMQTLLQSIDGRLRQIEGNTSGTDAGIGDIHTRLVELQQRVDPIEEIAED